MHDKMFAKYVSFDVLYRPIAGNVNFCPSAFTTGSSSVIFATAKHEVIHALVRNSLEKERERERERERGGICMHDCCNSL